MSNPVLEEYRRTWEALRALYQRKRAAGADPKELDLILTEMDEVAEVIKHLTKGENRSRWKLP